MKKIWIVLSFALLVVLVSCGQSDATGETELLGTMPPSSSTSGSTTPLEDEPLFVLSDANAHFDGNLIRISVANEVEMYAFIDFFKISNKYRWELHWDKACLPSLDVRSKTIDLEEGDNHLYALFVNKENEGDISLYEIIVHRDDNFKIFYLYNSEDCYIKIYPNNMVKIYDPYKEVVRYADEKEVKLKYQYISRDSNSYPMYEIDVTEFVDRDMNPGVISSYEYIIVKQENILMYKGCDFIRRKK